MLKGIPIKEAKNASDVKTLRIDSMLSAEVFNDMYKEVGITKIVTSAVKNEISVNIFRFLLFKKFISLHKNYLSFVDLIGISDNYLSILNILIINIF